jgi:hypothetical protein
MPLIKVYNNDSDPYGIKGHSIFKSVRPFIFGYAVIPKLDEWCLRRHVQAASAKAVSFCRTFGDEAWSQHKSSKFSTFQLLTRAKHSIHDTPKCSNPLPIPHKGLVISERDLLCSFELLRLDCFFLSFFLAINSIVTKARDTNCVVVLAGKFCSRWIKKKKLTRSEGPFERGKGLKETRSL